MFAFVAPFKFIFNALFALSTTVDVTVHSGLYFGTTVTSLSESVFVPSSASLTILLTISVPSAVVESVLLNLNDFLFLYIDSGTFITTSPFFPVSINISSWLSAIFVNAGPKSKFVIDRAPVL